MVFHFVLTPTGAYGTELLFNLLQTLFFAFLLSAIILLRYCYQLKTMIANLPSKIKKIAK